MRHGACGTRHGGGGGMGRPRRGDDDGAGNVAHAEPDRFAVDEFARMGEAGDLFTEDDRVELIDEAILKMTPPNRIRCPRNRGNSRRGVARCERTAGGAGLLE